MTSGVDLLDQIDNGKLPVGRLSAALSRMTGSPRRPSPRTRYNLACHLAPSDPERCLEILGDDSRREPHPWASEDPVLADLRKGPLAPAMRATLRRGRSVDPPGTLSRVDAIGTSGAEQLNRAGIYTPADLLGAAGPKESRARLAARLTREDAQLKEWASIAELALAIEAAVVRPAEQPPALDVANLLALAGIRSCAALGSTAGAAISSLAARMTRLNREQGVIEGSKAGAHLHAITQSVLKAWIGAARDNPTRIEPPDPPVPGAPKLEESMATQEMPQRGADAGESE
jgi:Domain of unknown function (DUF4332)